jgi:hypothetical protein
MIFIFRLLAIFIPKYENLRQSELHTGGIVTQFHNGVINYYLFCFRFLFQQQLINSLPYLHILKGYLYFIEKRIWQRYKVIKGIKRKVFFYVLQVAFCTSKFIHLQIMQTNLFEHFCQWIAEPEPHNVLLTFVPIIYTYPRNTHRFLGQQSAKWHVNYAHAATIV